MIKIAETSYHARHALKFVEAIEKAGGKIRDGHVYAPVDRVEEVREVTKIFSHHINRWV